MYGGLNGNGPHRSTGSGTIRRCGLVGGSVSWSELEVSEAQARPRVAFFPLPLDLELSAPSPALCLPAHCHASHPDNHELNL